MGQLKLAGFIAIALATAAMMAAAPAGAESTLLCQNNTKEIPSLAECNPPGSVHLLTATEESVSPAKATLLTSSLDVRCEILMIAKKPTTSGDSFVFSEATLSYANCSQCTLKVLKQGTLKVLKSGTELADVTASGFTVEVNCPGFFDCDYDAEGLVGHALGAAEAGTVGKGHVTFTGKGVHLLQDLLAPFSECPKSATLDALFQALVPLYIRSSAKGEVTLLCENNTKSPTPTVEECKFPNEAHFLTVAKDAPARLLSETIETKCNVLIQGTVLDTLVINGPVRVDVEASGLVYSDCNNSCATSTMEGGTLLILKTGVELAEVTADGFQVKMNCPFYNCDFSAKNLVGQAFGATVAGTNGMGHVTYSSGKVNLLKELSPFFTLCPVTAFLDALFESLVPIYIRS